MRRNRVTNVVFGLGLGADTGGSIHGLEISGNYLDTIVGTAAALSPAFAALGIPTFAWLVVGMLIVEVLAGLALKTHPSAIVTMPTRVAGLMTSFVVCYVMLGVLKSV